MAVHGRRDPSAQAHVDAAINDFLDEEIGARILADAKAFVPVDTGRLRDSLISEVHDKVLRVGSRDVEYATDVEMGTAPHVIRPRVKKALWWDGAPHPYAKVNHPGTRPQPFLRPALFQRRSP